MKLPEHIEKYLGRIDGGDLITHHIYGNISLPYIKNQPNEEVTTYLTLGLSNHILTLNENKRVRIELLISLYNNYPNEKIIDILVTISHELIKSHQSPLRGSTIHLKSSFLNIYNIEGFYITHPVFFDEDFWVYQGSKPNTVFLWLIPVFNTEINYIESNGWNKFEDLLEQSNCDFWNLNRQPLV